MFKIHLMYFKIIYGFKEHYNIFYAINLSFFKLSDIFGAIKYTL